MKSKHLVPHVQVNRAWRLVGLGSLLLLAGCGGSAAGASTPAFVTPVPNVLNPQPENQNNPGGSAAGKTTAAPAGLEAVLASSELTVGPNRVAIGLQLNSKPIGDAKVHVRYVFLGEADASGKTQVKSEDDPPYYGEGLPLGVYVSHVMFDKPGDWGAEVTASPANGQPLISRIRMTVKAQPSTPALGADAPRSHNQTVKDQPDLSKLSTDTSPDPDLYQLTVADAVTTGKPTLVLFASPAVCTSRTCGPAVEVLKYLKNRYKDQANYIHIELYKDLQTFETVPEVTEWGLPSEPFLFILDGKGKVIAKYEGGVTRAEIEPALQAVLAGKAPPGFEMKS